MARRLILLFAALLAIGVGRVARAAEAVDVALVLVTDVSRSVDDSEFKLEKDGYTAAFTDPRVLAAIRGGATGAIAVAYVEFAGADQVKTVLDWSIIRDAASAKSFTDKLQAAERSAYGRTAISAGIIRGMEMLAESGVDATRRVIDVAGDGTNNAGPDILETRTSALAAGITINGLAIINEHPVNWTFAHVQPPGGLPKWYEEHVTGGPGSFVVEVHDFHAFGEAMTRKLINEIAALPEKQRS